MDDLTLDVFSDYESPYQHTYYGGIYGARFENPLYDEYLDRIDKALHITETSTKNEEKDVIEVLKKSLENGKDFYSNAKPYMKKNMESLTKILEDEEMVV